MQTYLIKVLLTAISYIVLHCCIILFLPGPLPSAYWVREMIVVKNHQANQIAAPKIVFLGGSSVLFGIDAGMVQAATHIPAQNLGLHAGMRLEWLLAEADRVMRPRDILVMALEPNFYECGQSAWTQWQLYSALTWNHTYLSDSLPKKINAVLRGGSLDSPFTKIRAYWDHLMAPERVAPRFAAMAPPAEIVARYESGRFRTGRFAYSAYNVDEHGDLQNTAGTRYDGDAEDVTRPKGICADAKETLRPFVAKMTSRGVRVVFEYFPYLISGKLSTNWMVAEKRFEADIREIGGELLGARDEFFFQRNLFFNTVHHLNEDGRKVATKVIIRHLQKLGLEQHADVSN